jgi:hypothetical protein
LKNPKSVPAIVPCVRFTAAEQERNKKARDARRKAIRSQNARSKVMR